MKATLAVTICLWILGSAAWSDEPAARERTHSAVTLKREKQLKAGLADFRLDLAYIGPQDKPYYHLTLSARPVEQSASVPFHPKVVIDRAQAEKIVEYLASDGFLDRAIDDLNQNITLRAPTGPTYVLTVHAEGQEFGPVQWHEELGWGAKLIDRLDALKKVLDPKSVAPMETLLGRLGVQRSVSKTDSK